MNKLDVFFFAASERSNIVGQIDNETINTINMILQQAS
jgi:hypothetical protein